MTHVDMLKSATLYKPAAMKPNIAELITAPATLRTTNVIKTITANASLDRRSFGLWSLEGRINDTADFGAIGESWYVESRVWRGLGGRGDGGNT